MNEDIDNNLRCSIELVMRLLQQQDRAAYYRGFTDAVKMFKTSEGK